MFRIKRLPHDAVNIAQELRVVRVPAVAVGVHAEFERRVAAHVFGHVEVNMEPGVAVVP